MILIYLIFFFLILRFTVTVFNFISNPKLTPASRYHDELVSILIPARNEESNILTLLQSVKNQDYENLEVIVLDDNSTDSTFALCEIFCLSDRRFKVIRGKDLKSGWLGKNYACDQLADNASGRYFLFLDADEQIEPGLVNNCVHRMKAKNIQLLSLFTDQIMATWGERMVIPLMHYILLNLLPLRFVSIFKNASFAAASGQFMMFTSENYKQNRWHEMVKSEVVEDMEIMKNLKGLGYRAETLLGNGFIKCRMYKNLEQSVEGFSKNLLAGFNKSIPALLLFIGLVIIGPLVIAFVLTPELLLFGLSLIILTRVMISLMARQNVWHNLVLHPLQMSMLVLISVLSIQKHFTRRIYWKGRNVKVDNE